MSDKLSKEPRQFTAKEIVKWAWAHDIPQVPYEKSFEVIGRIYDALALQEIVPDQGVFTVSESVLYETLQAHKSEIFILISGGMSRETKEKLDAAYWTSVETDEAKLEQEFWRELLEEDYGSGPRYEDPDEI